MESGEALLWMRRSRGQRFQAESPSGLAICHFSSGPRCLRPRPVRLVELVAAIFRALARCGRAGLPSRRGSPPPGRNVLRTQERQNDFSPQGHGDQCGDRSPVHAESFIRFTSTGMARSSGNCFKAIAAASGQSVLVVHRLDQQRDVFLVTHTASRESPRCGSIDSCRPSTPVFLATSVRRSPRLHAGEIASARSFLRLGQAGQRLRTINRTTFGPGGGGGLGVSSPWGFGFGAAFTGQRARLAVGIPRSSAGPAAAALSMTAMNSVSITNQGAKARPHEREPELIEEPPRPPPEVAGLRL